MSACVPIPFSVALHCVAHIAQAVSKAFVYSNKYNNNINNINNKYKYKYSYMAYVDIHSPLPMRHNLLIAYSTSGLHIFARLMHSAAPCFSQQAKKIP
jgi:hypothetical protein